MPGLLIEQRHQQLLPPVGQAVNRQAFEAAALHEPNIEQDAQVATDASLLASSDQAQVANAGLPRFAQHGQEVQSVRIAERLSLTAPTGCLLEIEQPRTQPLSFPRLRPTQSWRLISDG